MAGARRVKMLFVVRTMDQDGNKRDDLLYVTIPEIDRIKKRLAMAYEAGDLTEFFFDDAVTASVDLETYKDILRSSYGIELSGSGPKDWNP